MISPTTLIEHSQSSNILLPAKHPKSFEPQHENPEWADIRIPERIGKCQVEKLLSKGGMSVVMLARDENWKPVILKLILKESNCNWKREIEIHSKLHHKHIIQCLGSMEDISLQRGKDLVEAVCLVLEYCDGPDLFTIISPNQVLGLRDQEIREIMLQLVDTLTHLHNQNIVHRDLKLENVLLQNSIPSTSLLFENSSPSANPTAQIHIKLIDFGLSKQFTDLVSNTKCGSEEYLAPEIILGLDYNPKCIDLWALGVIFYSLLQGNLPFYQLPTDTKKSFFSRICQANYTLLRPISSQADVILKSLLQPNPLKRSSLAELSSSLKSWST